LGQIFCIDVCAYAVMSNHYHIVLHLNIWEQSSLTLREFLTRWRSLYTVNYLVARYLREEPMCDAETHAIQEVGEQWRERLADLSWFMRALNEGVARKGRFKSQALLDEQTLMACMAYVDLNLIRAKMAKTPEQSDYTSAKKRIREAQQKPPQAHTPCQPRTLCSFVDYPREPMPQGLPYRLSDYLELLDWTGRIIRDDKRGAIPGNTPKVLDRLNIEAKNWLHSARHFERSFKLFAGKMASVKAAFEALGYQRIPTVGALLT